MGGVGHILAFAGKRGPMEVCVKLSTLAWNAPVILLLFCAGCGSSRGADLGTGP